MLLAEPHEHTRLIELLCPGNARAWRVRAACPALCAGLPILCFTSPPIFVSRLFRSVRPPPRESPLLSWADPQIVCLSGAATDSLSAALSVASPFTFCATQWTGPYGTGSSWTCLPSCSGPWQCWGECGSASRACCAPRSASSRSAFWSFRRPAESGCAPARAS